MTTYFKISTKVLATTLLLFLFAPLQASKPKSEANNINNEADQPSDDEKEEALLVSQEKKQQLKKNTRNLFNFNGLNNNAKHSVQSDDTAPTWRAIHAGLNLVGLCTNQACAVFDKEVWAPQGFGTFFMSKVASLAGCPICKSEEKKLKSVLTCAFSKCNYIIKGEYKDAKNKKHTISKKGKHDTKSLCELFLVDESNIKQYVWLEITVKKL